MNKQSLLYMSPIETFYDTKKEVIENNLKRHEEVFCDDRELYTYLLYFNNAKYYSKELIMCNLLKNSLHKEDNFNKEDLDIEDYLIYRALLNENITHALKMLLSLKDNKINNSRTSKLILRFLFDRGNLDYISIKYKSKIKELLIHALGLKNINKVLSGDKCLFDKKIGVYKNPYAYECFMFIFNKDVKVKSEYIQAYLDAKKAILDGNSLKIKKGLVPIEVLEGFVHDSKRYFCLENLYEVANVSEKQLVQKQKVLKDKGVVRKKEIDYSKLSFNDLIKLLYNGSLEEVDKEKVNSEIDKKLISLKKFFSNIEETAFIFDFSLSLEGSNSNKYNAFYKELELYYSLNKDFKDNIFFIGSEIKNDLIYPAGNSNISKAVLDCIQKGFKKVVLISDGFENVGNIDILYKKLLELELKVEILHLNPVFSAKDMDFKILSNEISTLPFDKISDLEFLEIFSLLENNEEEFKKVMRNKILNEIKSI